MTSDNDLPVIRYGACDSKERTVCDYIAGMSDSYAITLFENLFISKSWKV